MSGSSATTRPGSYLLLAQSLGRHIVSAYRDWIDEVERELGAP